MKFNADHQRTIMDSKRKRPIGITLLAAVFLWIGCLGTPAFLLIALSGGLTVLLGDLVSGWFASEVLTRIVVWSLALIWFMFYVLYAVIGIGLWRLKRWGRQIAFILFTAGAAITAIALPFFARSPVLIFPMTVGLVAPFALIAWYLNIRSIRVAFGEVVPQEPTTETKTSNRPHLRMVWIVVGVLFVILAFIGSLWFAVDRIMRSSEPYQIAIAHAKSSACVTSIIGEHFEDGWLMTGGFQESAKTGSANLSIPVEGSVGKGRLRVSAEKREGNWIITEMKLSTKDREIRIAPIEDSCY